MTSDNTEKEVVEEKIVDPFLDEGTVGETKPAPKVCESCEG